MRAAVLILRRPPYYGDEVAAALRDMGYSVSFAPLADPKPGDVIVTWNRHYQREAPVIAHERAGGTVIVMENGYLGRDHPGGPWFALSLDQHNGAGRWPASEDWSAVDRMGVKLKPWREEGDDIVVLASRNMGSPTNREPIGWAVRVAGALKSTGRRVRIRAHPGPQGAVPLVSLEDDLSSAWCAVTWGSTAGLKALIMGVPVCFGFRSWIGAPAGRYMTHAADVGRLESPNRPGMLLSLATAMWTLDEIRAGDPFRRLLGAGNW